MATNGRDPTRTATLRRTATQQYRKRFRLLDKRVRKLLVEDDVFGLKQGRPRTPTLNANATKYGAVLLMLEDARLTAELHRLRLRLNRADVLEYETQPHVTIRYGFETGVTPEQVQRVLDQHTRPPLRVGRLSLFQNKDADVLKLDIHRSAELLSIYSHLGLFRPVSGYFGFHPHITLAYLKPGTGAKYLDLPHTLTGKELRITRTVYSTADRKKTSLVLNNQWQFRTQVEQVELFQQWLEKQLSELILDELAPPDQDKYWEEYVRQGYEKGAGRAYVEANKAGIAVSDTVFVDGSKTQFLRTQFAQPETVQKVKLLAGRVFTDLKGINQDTSAKLSRALTDGLVQGDSPYNIAKNISQDLRINSARAERIARTEIIRAHAEGALDSMESMGMQHVGVAVEWEVSKDTRLCPLCAPLDGIVLSIEEAHGMFPRHPNCRCTPIPANLGESTKGQLRGKPKINKAIDESVKRELGKRGKRKTVAQQRKLSRWGGSRTTIKKSRPKSILDE